MKINGLDRAVTTIAQFSQDLHSTLTPLTQQLQRAIDFTRHDGQAPNHLIVKKYQIQ